MKKILQKLNRLNKLKTQRGFTLIEALLGSAMMLIAVLGPLSVTMNGIKTITENKNRIIATYLSEEIIESLKNYRDSFSLLCKDMTFVYSGDGSQIIAFIYSEDGSPILVAKCGTLDISKYINLYNVQTTPQLTAWKTFLYKLDLKDLNLNQSKIFNAASDSVGSLDQGSFPTDPKLFLDPHTSCKNLYLHSNNYSCSSINGQTTIFERTVTLTKISETAIKVEVSVIYAKSSLPGMSDKSVTVIDYIYMR